MISILSCPTLSAIASGVNPKDKEVSYIAFEILYWCGIRLGELLALTPADFNFKTDTLSITQFVNY